MATITTTGTRLPAAPMLDPRRWVALTLLCLAS